MWLCAKWLSREHLWDTAAGVLLVHSLLFPFFLPSSFFLPLLLLLCLACQPPTQALWKMDKIIPKWWINAFASRFIKSLVHLLLRILIIRQHMPLRCSGQSKSHLDWHKHNLSNECLKGKAHEETEYLCRVQGHGPTSLLSVKLIHGTQCCVMRLYFSIHVFVLLLFFFSLAYEWSRWHFHTNNNVKKKKLYQLTALTDFYIHFRW